MFTNDLISLISFGSFYKVFPFFYKVQWLYNSKKSYHFNRTCCEKHKINCYSRAISLLILWIYDVAYYKPLNVRQLKIINIQFLMLIIINLFVLKLHLEKCVVLMSSRSKITNINLTKYHNSTTLWCNNNQNEQQKVSRLPNDFKEFKQKINKKIKTTGVLLLDLWLNCFFCHCNLLFSTPLLICCILASRFIIEQQNS